LATAEGRILLTNDQDFLAIHAAWLSEGKEHAGIVYWNANRLTVGDAIHRIVGIATRTSSRDVIGQLIYL